MKILILILLLNITWINAGHSKKKTTEEATPSTVTDELSNFTEEEESSSKEDSPPPAIVAIEIVDPADNSTEARTNTKRTIESNLGYGFQGNIYQTQKKYMIYPYSQHDIPPSPVASIATPITSQRDGSRAIEIQKAITYNLGTRIEPAVKYNQQNIGYYPSTLYSTLTKGGNIGGLSTQFPGNYHGRTVPVIIFRVFSNHLTNPNQGIYPNLPQSHPQANYLNNVNLQELVLRYLNQQKQKLYYQAQQAQVQQAPVYQAPVQQSPVYQAPVYQNDQGYGHQEAQQVPSPPPTQYQPVGVYQTQYPTSVPVSDPTNLPTHENYPDDDHTRVIYHSPRGHIQGGVSYSTIHMNYNPNTVSIPSKLPENRYNYKDSGYKQQVQIAPAVQQNYDYQAPVNYYYDTPKQVQQQYVIMDAAQVKQNTIYTDQNGQNYIYVLPGQQAQYNQLQNDYGNQNLYYQQDSQYDQNDYVDENQSTEKHYNYHAHDGKKINERSKKNSGSPVTFEDDSKKKKN